MRLDGPVGRNHRQEKTTIKDLETAERTVGPGPLESGHTETCPALLKERREPYTLKLPNSF